MEDEAIIQLYWDRDEAAIPATAEKYGARCAAVAQNILGSAQDAEECVNDAYLHIWNAIPPHRPASLSVFLLKLVRNLSLNRYKGSRARKRGGGELPAVLDELREIVPGDESVEEQINRQELIRAINGFLAAPPPDKRDLFLRRYWYADSVSAIARRCGRREGAVSMALSRLRRDLQRYLTERGWIP